MWDGQLKEQLVQKLSLLLGSVFKIDASYLSPNVNMASRLEAATKQYGVPLLLSNELVDCMSKKG